MKLSICVPTYNRRTSLQRLLDNLSDELTDDVEVCISDNASTDKTKTMVKEYLSNNIRYQRNKVNLGYDKNIVAVIKMAKGDYCWFMGDDDIFVPHAIKSMLVLLRSNPAYVIASFTKDNTTLDYEKTIAEEINMLDPSFKSIKCDVWNVGFMGTHCFRRENATLLLTQMEESHVFAHLRLFYHIMNDHGSITIVKQPFIIQESNGIHASSKKIATLFIKNLPSLIKELYVKDKVLTQPEYELIMNNIHQHLDRHLIPAMIVSYKDKNDLLDAATVFKNEYCNCVVEDSMILGKIYSFIMIRPQLLRIIAFNAKIMFEILYIRVFNFFRRTEIPSPYSQQHNKNTREPAY